MGRIQLMGDGSADVSSESEVGKLGRVVIAVRGRARPGEVMVRIRGGTEAFIAYSDEDLPVGSSVIVIGRGAARSVEVTAFDD